MSKIEAIGKWSAKAALHDALSVVDDKTEVLVLFRKEEGKRFSYRSANLTNGNAMYLLVEAQHAFVDDLFGEE
jgi:hypothetical protein